MEKKDVNIIRKQKSIALKSILGLSIIWIGVSCDKQSAEEMNGTLAVSTSEYRSDAISRLDLTVDGGKDTLYVFSSSDVNVVFQTGEPEDWVAVEKKEYMAQQGITRVILNVQPLADDFKIRSGILHVTGQEKYSGSFIKLSQGYESRFSEDFAWLRYGNGNPLDLVSGVLMDNWSPAQKQYNWTSTVAEGQSQAFVYGKNGYVQLGSDVVGADLFSPIIPGITKDSILLLTFDAVSYISREGMSDGNLLTVNIIGAEFEDGGDSKVVELAHYDYGSALLVTKMWDNSKFSFRINKTKNNPTSSTLQVQFLTNTDIAVAENRVFLDNVAVYTVAEFKEKK